MKYLVLIVFFLLYSLQAQKTLGIPFPDQDNSTNGMACNFSGLNPDASVAWTDPAALLYIDSVYSISFSIDAVMRNTKFQATEPSLYQAITDNPVLYPFQFSFATKISPVLSLGISIQPANSQQINWQEENWTGRFLIRDYRLNALVIQPVFSIKLSEMIAVGGGLVISDYHLVFNRSLPIRDINREAIQNITGKSTQLGINLGISANLTKNFYLSVNYKSSQIIKFNDTDVANTVPYSLSHPAVENSAADIRWPLPGKINLMASYGFNTKWEASASMAMYFFNRENDLKVDFPFNSDFISDFTIPGSNRTEVIYRLGLSFDASNYFRFRTAGWYSHGNSDENFLFPAMINGPRIGFGGSTSFLAIKGLSLNLNFAAAYFFKNTGYYSPGNFGGVYKTISFHPGFGINISF
jgi:long-subunit fatty acid transport protein